jgi:hypothetical protein
MSAKIKIIQIDGRQPRKAVDYKGNTYDPTEVLVKGVDAKGNLTECSYAVFEFPEDFAKVKLSGAPDRYLPYECESVTLQVVSANLKREWKTINGVKFDIKTVGVLDPETGAQKKNGKGEPVVITTQELFDVKTKKVVSSKPYKVVEKNAA